MLALAVANVLAANGVRILYAGEATTGALSASVLIRHAAGAVAARTGLLSHILNNDWFNRGHLTRQVRDYRETIDRYTAEYQIPAFTPVIQAMMMQESKGLGRDPMQASESPHNVIYQKSPNSIQDPDYSIQVGTKYFAV